jgi:hypothetical protein
VSVPKASKETTSRVEDMGVIELRYEELGGYTIAFETFRENADATPLFKDLPDDRRQSPHWGYVVTGTVTFRYADREEVYESATPITRPLATSPRSRPGRRSSNSARPTSMAAPWRCSAATSRRCRGADGGDRASRSH